MQRLALMLALFSSAALAWPRAALAPDAARALAADAPRWGEAESAALDAQIAALEERLLAHQARVAFWQEMRARHEEVTAVACENLGDHAAAMRAGEARFQVHLAAQRHRRVAAAAAQ